MLGMAFKEKQKRGKSVCTEKQRQFSYTYAAKKDIVSVYCASETLEPIR